MIVPVPVPVNLKHLTNPFIPGVLGLHSIPAPGTT